MGSNLKRCNNSLKFFNQDRQGTTACKKARNLKDARYFETKFIASKVNT